MTNVPAESAFVRRLAAAARAAWWTFLIGAGLAIVQFLAYCVISCYDPLWDWLRDVFETDRRELHRLALHFMMAVRLILVLVAIGAIFLSLWVHRLRRLGDA